MPWERRRYLCDRAAHVQYRAVQAVFYQASGYCHVIQSVRSAGAKKSAWLKNAIYLPIELRNIRDVLKESTAPGAPSPMQADLVFDHQRSVRLLQVADGGQPAPAYTSRYTCSD